MNYIEQDFNGAILTGGFIILFGVVYYLTRNSNNG